MVMYCIAVDSCTIRSSKLIALQAESAESRKF